MTHPDFETTDLYRRVQELTTWVNGLEDRFPDSDVPILYSRLRGSVLDLGSSVAEAISRDGVAADGSLSAAGRREARGRLGALRHLVLTSIAQFLLDEDHARTFQKMYEPLREALAAGPGEE